jgi:hypothetical protein
MMVAVVVRDDGDVLKAEVSHDVSPRVREVELIAEFVPRCQTKRRVGSSSVAGRNLTQRRKDAKKARKEVKHSTPLRSSLRLCAFA